MTRSGCWEDKFRVIETINAFVTVVDLGMWSEAADLLEARVLVDYPDGRDAERAEAPVLGRDVFLDALKRVLGRYAGTQHAVTNHVVNLDDGSATCRSFVRAVHIHPSATNDPWWLFGTYVHSLLRTDHVWRISGIQFLPTGEFGRA